MDVQNEANASPVTCISYARDLRALFAFSRRLVAAEQKPILASDVELVIELAQELSLNIVAMRTPGGNSFEYVYDVANKLSPHISDLRLLCEVTDPSADAWAKLEQNGGSFFFGRDDAPARIKAVFDVATFSNGLVGSVVEIELVDFLQLLIMNCRSSAISVQGRNCTGSIIIERGQIVDAHCGLTRGHSALMNMLSQQHGHFAETPMPETIERSIEGRSDMLILEAMRLRDEAQRDGSLTKDNPAQTVGGGDSEHDLF